MATSSFGGYPNLNPQHTETSSFWSSFDGLSETFLGSASTPGHRGPTKISQLFTNFNLSPEVKEHLFNIYSTLGLMIAAAAVGAIATFNSPQQPWLWGIINIVATLCFAFSSPHTQFLNVINLQSVLLYTIAATTGILTVPLLVMANIEAPKAIPVSLVVTTILFAALTLAAIKAERSSVLHLYGGVTMLFGALSFYGVMMSLFGFSVLPTLLWSTISLLITFFAVILETQSIIYAVEQGNGHPDHKQAALSMFWNFCKIFVRVLNVMIKVLGNNDKKRDNDHNRRR